MKLLTTLSIIRQNQPCADGWAKLLRHLGPEWPHDKPIGFDTILESNGLKDALWVLRAVVPEQEKDRDRLARLFACDCAKSVLHLFEEKYAGDKRPRRAIATARSLANGESTEKDLDAASDAASEAALAASWAASDASWAASYAAWADSEAASDAAYSARASSYAAWAASYAASEAASEAASYAASAAEGQKQLDLFKTYFC